MFTGEKIDLNTQVKIMKVIDAKCKKLYDRNQNTLIEHQYSLYNGGLKPYQYEEKWNEVLLKRYMLKHKRIIHYPF